jgi:hypothetical protein
VAILQLLGLCGSERAIGPLLSLSRETAWRTQALETLETALGPEGLAQAARQSGDARVRRKIYQRLLQDASTVDVYLGLVRDRRMSDEALSVAEGLQPPSLDALLARLDSQERETRLAAALVLGQANGPAVTDALITYVARHPAEHQEAWIALLACRGPQVDQFLAYAAYQPKLLGPINRARAYWARLVH